MHCPCWALYNLINHWKRDMNMLLIKKILFNTWFYTITPPPQDRSIWKFKFLLATKQEKQKNRLILVSYSKSTFLLPSTSFPFLQSFPCLLYLCFISLSSELTIVWFFFPRKHVSYFFNHKHLTWKKDVFFKFVITL